MDRVGVGQALAVPLAGRTGGRHAQLARAAAEAFVRQELPEVRVQLQQWRDCGVGQGRLLSASSSGSVCRRP